MYVDPKLDSQLKVNPEKTVGVVIICDGCSDALKLKLEQSGLHVSNDLNLESGLICGSIRLSDISNLKNIKGINSIELDSTQIAF